MQHLLHDLEQIGDASFKPVKLPILNFQCWFFEFLMLSCQKGLSDYPLGIGYLLLCNCKFIDSATNKKLLTQSPTSIVSESSLYTHQLPEQVNNKVTYVIKTRESQQLVTNQRINFFELYYKENLRIPMQDFHSKNQKTSLRVLRYDLQGTIKMN